MPRCKTRCLESSQNKGKPRTGHCRSMTVTGSCVSGSVSSIIIWSRNFSYFANITVHWANVKVKPKMAEIEEATQQKINFLF